MSTWSPFTLEGLHAEVRSGEAAMRPDLSRLWQAVRIDFAKWQLPPWGDRGNGFWVVGLIGEQVLWYNDIEEGFNWSRYSSVGVIDEYWCNQDELNYSIYQLQMRLEGKSITYKAGPPSPLQ